MCTRFYIEPATDEFKEIIEAMKQSGLTKRFLRTGCAVHTSGEIRPTDVVPVIAPGRDTGRKVFPMKWGFRIPGKSLLVNARTETASQKPTFREAWSRHRCIIPASWYYEWEHFVSSSGKKKTGAKYMIRPEKARVTWLCGLYRIEDGLPVFTVLTREPSEEIRRIHDRMPLILPQDLTDAWISPETRPEELLKYALTDLTAEKTE